MPGPRGHEGQVSAREHAECVQHGLTRRGLLAAIGGGAAVSAAGCLSTQTPEPVTVRDDDACDVCGMIIPQHPGPSAEVFYRNHDPSGHENPARFDSTWEAFQYDFERRDRGWSRAAFYVTDYSSVEYEIFTDDGTTFISTHPSAEAFTHASEVTFVVASSVEGAMGRDLIGFSSDDDATAFADEYGGSRAQFGDVTRSMIGELAQT
ncbi:nitrous oxide reductase accessory protein NosL [Halorhabdus sp. SVX81]|uniref:nitrous oxide reductase accessory protein NosL n=1 Tax=Halorhabdus sp. SVX81 TaxID=2978283 RepID=UPI0023D9FD36|nr:nitrous oxide reductase accessory protein NosL [Halorhabdus sp. SVX81]